MAKKTFVELVYNTAYIEGCNVSFPQTQTIDCPLDLEYVCEINEFVSRNESLQWGILRNETVGVSDFIPSIPVKKTVITEQVRILEISDCIERAIEYFTYACMQQLFGDRNKRASTIVAGEILIESGTGDI